MGVSHRVSENGMYGATAWRGDWKVNLQVEETEMWIEV